MCFESMNGLSIPSPLVSVVLSDVRENQLSSSKRICMEELTLISACSLVIAATGKVFVCGRPNNRVLIKGSRKSFIQSYFIYFHSQIVVCYGEL